MVNNKQVTRLEVIGDKGREYVNMNIPKLRLHYQDNGKTLKIFINE